MRLFKRAAVLLFAFALILTACGGDDEAETTTTQGTAAPTTAAPATTEAPTTTAAGTEAPTTTSAPTGGGTVIIGTTDAVAGLDSSDAYAVRDWELIKNFGEPLLRFEPGSDNKIVPGIAELPTVSDDGLTWTVTLRDGVKFGDGLDVTAQLVASQLNRLKTISSTGPNQVGLYLTDPYVDEIVAVDDKTIEFHMTGPVGFFPQILVGAPYAPAHPDIFPEDELNVFPDPPIYGTGPWIITDWAPQDFVQLEPNPYYNGDYPAKVDKVIVQYFSNPQTMADAVREGEIDVAWRLLGTELAEELSTVDGLNVEKINSGPIRYLIVNHADGFVPADSNVRKALAASIDRDELSDVVFGGAVAPLYSQVPPGFLGANEAFDDAYASPDLDLAREYLTAAGYSEDNPLQLDLAYPPEHYGVTTADGVLLIAEQFKATGMIDVNVVSEEWSTYVGNLTRGDTYDVGVLGWFYDFPDAENYLSPFIENGGNGTNVTSSETGEITPGVNEDLLNLLFQQRAEGDEATRADLIGQLQDVYADEVVTIPLWIEPEYITYRDGISGDPNYGYPEALNIGPAFEFLYSMLQVSG